MGSFSFLVSQNWATAKGFLRARLHRNLARQSLNRVIRISEGEERGTLLTIDLGDLAILHQLVQQSRSLLTADAEAHGNLTRAVLTALLGEVVHDLILEVGVLTLSLGRLVGLRGVPLLQLLTEGNQLVDNLDCIVELLAVDGTQGEVNGVNPFWFGRFSFLFLTVLLYHTLWDLSRVFPKLFLFFSFGSHSSVSVSKERTARTSFPFRHCKYSTNGIESQ